MNPFRAVFQLVGSLTSAAIPMAIAARTQQAYEQGLVEWEAENEVAEPVTQDRYFGPRGPYAVAPSRRTVDILAAAAEMFPQHTRCGECGRDKDLHSAGCALQRAAQSSAVFPPGAAADRPAPPDSTTVEARATQAAPGPGCPPPGSGAINPPTPADHHAAGLGEDSVTVPENSLLGCGDSDRPTSELLNDAAVHLTHYLDRYESSLTSQLNGRAFIADLRARAAMFREIEQDDEPDTAPGPTSDDPLRRAFGLTPGDPIPDSPM